MLAPGEFPAVGASPALKSACKQAAADCLEWILGVIFSLKVWNGFPNIQNKHVKKNTSVRECVF